MTGPARPIRVLFVCTGNSARSQLAEAILGRVGGDRFVAASAGVAPAGVNPLTIRVLAARGIDWSGAGSRHVDEVAALPWDHVVTVCDGAREACPVIAGARSRRHWALADPAAVAGDDAERIAAFARTARELDGLIEGFVREALADEPGGTRPA